MKTVSDGYLRPLKAAMTWMCSEYRLPDPWRDVRLARPRAADLRPSTEREPFDVAALNRIFAEAAKRDRKDDHWLPLLGAFTGTRVGELAWLHAEDIKRQHGYWCIDLSEIIIMPDGKAARRPLKTGAARRLVPLHHVISGTDFIPWAKRCGSGPLFRQLQSAKDPAGTASKRMNRLLKDVGVHVPYTRVHHTLRHTYKYWLEKADIPTKTAKLVVGHALSGVHERYGAKQLDGSDLERLHDLPLPRGLDLSPYLRPRLQHCDRGEEGRLVLALPRSGKLTLIQRYCIARYKLRCSSRGDLLVHKGTPQARYGLRPPLDLLHSD